MNNNIIGVDEVGRGSLVGSVIVCAFKSSNIFFKNFPYEIKDSKKLSKLKRNLIYKELRKEKFNGSIDYKICFGKKREIELLNIHNTVLNSMNKAVNKMEHGEGRGARDRKQAAETRTFSITAK